MKLVTERLALIYVEYLPRITFGLRPDELIAPGFFNRVPGINRFSGHRFAYDTKFFPFGKSRFKVYPKWDSRDLSARPGPDRTVRSTQSHRQRLIESQSATTALG